MSCDVAIKEAKSCAQGAPATFNDSVYNSYIFKYRIFNLLCSLAAQTVKNLPAMQETQVWSQGWEDSLEEEIPVFWPREFHGQRSLEAFSPWGRKESDMTERLIVLLWPSSWYRQHSNRKKGKHNPSTWKYQSTEPKFSPSTHRVRKDTPLKVIK